MIAPDEDAGGAALTEVGWAGRIGDGNEPYRYVYRQVEGGGREWRWGVAMPGGGGGLVPCPICEGTGIGRAAVPGVPGGYCTGRGRVPRALVPELREAHRLARTADWLLRAAAAWRREVDRA